MAITADTLRWFQSERMTDEDDGGGQMSGNEIVPGIENQVFDDLSDVDRAAGDVSIRKIYASVASPDDDKYLDAGVVVFRHPADPDVSVLVFSTGDYYDERADLRARLEQSVARGPAWSGYLWGPHYAGQRSLLLWQYESAAVPVQGARLDLAAFTGSVEQYSQMVWVTRVTEEVASLEDDKGPFAIRSVTLEIAEPLVLDYTGGEPSRYTPAGAGLAARVFDSRYVPDAVPLVGIRPLVAPAGVGDYTVQVDSLYAPLIPTALTETALPDATPGGDSATLVGTAAGPLSWSTTADAVRPGAGLYLGSPCLPGSLSIVVSGSTITDSGGDLWLASVQVGTIDYNNGVCTWTDACPAYGAASKAVSFVPACVPLRVADTTRQAVTVENRGYVWVITLSPIPQPGSLRVSYRVNDAWYMIEDRGNGILRGADSSHGSGSLTFATGTVTITTGAIPDPGSDILFAWGVPVNYFARGGDPVVAPAVSGQVAHPGVAPGTVTVAWTVAATTYTLTDDGAGTLTGTGGAGTIRYATGEWEVTPTTVPPAGTDFTVAYDYGDLIEEIFVGPPRDGEGNIQLTLADLPRAGSVEVEWDLEMTDLGDQWAMSTEYIPPALLSPVNLGRAY